MKFSCFFIESKFCSILFYTYHDGSKNFQKFCRFSTFFSVINFGRFLPIFSPTQTPTTPNSVFRAYFWCLIRNFFWSDELLSFLDFKSEISQCKTNFRKIFCELLKISVTSYPLSKKEFPATSSQYEVANRVLHPIATSYSLHLIP